MKKSLQFSSIISIFFLFGISGCNKLSEYADKFYKRQGSTPEHQTPPPQQSNQNQQVAQNSSSTAHASSSSTSYTRFSLGEINQLIDLHNEVRADVGVAPISWSNTLASTAQAWANQLGQRGCDMQHSQSHYGENLFMSWGGNYGASDAVRSWESEKQYYHGQIIGHSNYTTFGHYTQIVWRNTQYIGCGKATCGQKIVIVCNYNPAGNYIGQRPY